MIDIRASIDVCTIESVYVKDVEVDAGPEELVGTEAFNEVVCNPI